MGINIRSAFIKEDFEQFKNKINARPDSCVTEEKVKAAYLNISGARDHKINAAQKRIKEIEATGIKICKVTPGELQKLGIHLEGGHTESDLHGWNDELKKMDSERSRLFESIHIAFFGVPVIGAAIYGLSAVVLLVMAVAVQILVSPSLVILGTVLGCCAFGGVVLGFGVAIGGPIVAHFMQKKFTELGEKIKPLKDEFINQEEEFARIVSHYLMCQFPLAYGLLKQS